MPADRGYKSFSYVSLYQDDRWSARLMEPKKN